MRPILMVVLLALGGCGRAAPAPVAVSAPPPKPMVTFAPGTTRYRGVSRLRVGQQIEGRLQVRDFEVTYFATSALAPGVEGGLRATLILDSILPTTIDASTDAEGAKGRGMRFTGVLSADGRLADFAGHDSLPPGRIRRLVQALREFFPTIPVGGVEPGQIWTDTTASTTSGNGAVALTIRSVNTHEVGGWSNYGDERALPIQTSATYTLSGEGQQSGQAFRVQGTGVHQTTQFLSAAGRYLGQRSLDSATVNVSFTGIGLVIPGQEIQADTLAAIPG